MKMPNARLLAGVKRQITGAFVTFFAAACDVPSRRVTVRSQLPNPDAALKAEMFATFKIATDAVEQAPGIPEDGVVRDGEGATVWIQVEPLVFQRRRVKLGREQDGLVQIKEGLKEASKDGKEFERPGDPRGLGSPGLRGTAGGAISNRDPLADALGVLDQAVSFLHSVIEFGAAANGGAATPYIDASLRPDLYGGPNYAEASSDAEKRMAEGDPMAKREFDAPPIG